MVYAFGHFFYPGFRNAPIAYQPLVILGEVLLFGFGLGLQFYRYLRVSNPIERQQNQVGGVRDRHRLYGLYTYRVANSFFPFLTTYAPESPAYAAGLARLFHPVPWCVMDPKNWTVP
jgi:hypothetical protein